MTHSNQKALIFILPLIFALVGPYSVNDLAGWVAYGLHFLKHGELLRQDIYSVLPTSSLVYPSWGISVVYALIYQKGGLLWTCLFHVLILAVLLGIVYRHSILSLGGLNSKTRYWMYLFWLGALPSFGERPSTVALIPFMLAFIEISQIQTTLTGSRFFRLCLIQILWVNIHGSFILLPIMLFWKILVSAFIKREGLTSFGASLRGGCLITASSLINPFYGHVFPYVWETAIKSQNRILSEWGPTWIQSYFPTGFLFWVLFWGGLIGLVKHLRTHQNRDSWQILAHPFLPLMVLGTLAIRNATLPFVALLPFCKSAGLLEGPRPVKRMSGRVSKETLQVFIFAVVFVLFTPFFRPYIAPFLPEQRRTVFDHSAVFQITEHIRSSGKTCPIFNHWEVGTFLMLEVQNKIFVDGRNIIYSDVDLQRYGEALQAKPGWDTYLNQHQACLAILNTKENAALIQAMVSSNWKWALQEQDMVLLERK